MKKIKLIVALALLGAVGVSDAWADRDHWGHRGHVQFGLTIGPYWGAPWYYPPPAYYYPPYYPQVVVERPVPQVYIEQQPAPEAPPAAAVTAPASYWYYCTATQGYYPYVRECPGGWQRVVPQPPAQPGN